jgi:sodium pump decarboxylase gamma subunit
MSTFTHGLVLTVVGMGLVFLALGILLISMVILTRLFPSRETNARVDTAKAGGQVPPSGPSEAEVAAIGAALSIWSKGASASQLGDTLSSPPSSWGIAAREAGRRS